MKLNRRWRSGDWSSALLLLAGMAGAWLILVAGLEIVLNRQGSWMPLFSLSAENAREVLGGMPEVMIGILGITVTVVSITLQLAATRYSHRVTEMFFHDKGNLGVLFFFVIASIHCIVAAALIRNGIVPQVFLVSTLLIVAMAVLVLIPYFMYVFAFLDPARLVIRLEFQAINAFLRGRTGPGPQAQLKAQMEFRQAVEQLSDVAIHALSKRERGIASTTTEALKQAVVTYLGMKAGFQEQWFRISDALRRSPELEIMAHESVQRLERDRCWIEWMVLSQLATIYRVSLNSVPDVSRLVAINTRQLAEYALRAKDEPVLNLAIRFFNSYLRAAISKKDVRSGYNVLDQYRHLAESALLDDFPEVAVQIGEYLNYYGNAAIREGLSFLAETAAIDLASLCVFAHERQSASELAILTELLTMEDQSGQETDRKSLQGIRKAQIKLGTYYLSVGADERACSIAAKLEHEPVESLARIRAELDKARHPEFWEVIDRGQNFDYLPPKLREQLDRFYQLASSPQLEIGV